MTLDPHILTGPKSGIAASGASYSLRHRTFRAVWTACWVLLAAWTPPPLHGWRRLILRAFGARIDRTAKVHGSARIWYPPNLWMEAGSVLGPRVTCYNMALIVIEEGAIVSQGAHLCGGTHAVDQAGFQLLTEPILICAGAWIAAEAFVGPGVTVGTRAVLGARGVTFSDLPAGTINIGNPARMLRARGP